MDFTRYITKQIYEANKLLCLFEEETKFAETLDLLCDLESEFQDVAKDVANKYFEFKTALSIMYIKSRKMPEKAEDITINSLLTILKQFKEKN